MAVKSNGSESYGGSLFAAYMKIFVVICLYWFCSITMVFLNKYLLSSPDLKLDAPLFITWFQCLISLALCLGLDALSRTIPNHFTFPACEFRLEACYKILPLSIIFVAMITFNNLCLKYVGVSFYFVGRSLSTVFNVICTYLILGQITSMRAIICCGIIVFGFCLGVDQEDVAGSLSVIGVVFGVLASLTVALNAIFTKKALPEVSENIWLLTFYNNVNAVALFVPLMVIAGEVEIMAHFEKLFHPNFLVLMTISGVFGFAMSYVTGLQIQVTSALTHNISGTAKAAAQTVLAVAWYAEVKSFLWWASNGLVLLGSAAYTYVRQQEMAKRGGHEKNLLPTSSGGGSDSPDRVALLSSAEEKYEKRDV